MKATACSDLDKPFLFISYSSQDTDVVQRTLAELERNHFRFWYDDGIPSGDFFAETFAWLSDAVMPVEVIANEDCSILFLNIAVLRTLSPVQHPWTATLIANLLTIAAHKNLRLTGRNFHTSPKSARSRIMAYLNSVSLQKQSREFDIPFDRQQLADYLNLERSAMSKELGRMRDEGLIRTKKKHFVLL